MNKATSITCMFLDIGGVLLTNGWDHHARGPMFVQVAQGLGIRSILHTGYSSTCAQLAALGLHHDEGGRYENI